MNGVLMPLNENIIVTTEYTNTIVMIELMTRIAFELDIFIDSLKKLKSMASTLKKMMGYAHRSHREAA